jgi:hypothetical protein
VDVIVEIVSVGKMDFRGKIASFSGIVSRRMASV